MRNIFKFIHDDRGQSILEIAVATPFMLLLLLAIVEFGRYMYGGVEVSNAARAGVQYGSQSVISSGDTNGIINATKADASDITTLNVTPSTFCVCGSNEGTQISCTGTSPCFGTDRVEEYVQVVASNQFKPFLKYPGLPATLTITRTVNQQVSP